MLPSCSPPLAFPVLIFSSHLAAERSRCEHLGWPWGWLNTSSVPATPRSRISSPPPPNFSLFYGHRWPSRPVICFNCWRSYRVEQRIVVRAAEIYHCLLEKPLRRKGSANLGLRGASHKVAAGASVHGNGLSLLCMSSLIVAFNDIQ